MDAYRLSTSAVARHGMVSLLLLVAMTGCGGSRGDRPSVESLVAIENVAKWYQLYQAGNAGKQPADEEAFLAFIDRKLTERGQEAVNRKKLLMSPRDGEPYVIRYGKVNSKNQAQNLVAYEKNGANGLKLIVSSLAMSRVVDESELQSLLSNKEAK